MSNQTCSVSMLMRRTISTTRGESRKPAVLEKTKDL